MIRNRETGTNRNVRGEKFRRQFSGNSLRARRATSSFSRVLSISATTTRARNQTQFSLRARVLPRLREVHGRGRKISRSAANRGSEGGINICAVSVNNPLMKNRRFRERATHQRAVQYLRLYAILRFSRKSAVAAAAATTSGRCSYVLLNWRLFQ